MFTVGCAAQAPDAPTLDADGLAKGGDLELTYCDYASCAEGEVCDHSTGGCVSEPAGEVCGEETCMTDEECCNSSCGICVQPGQSCLDVVCDDKGIAGTGKEKGITSTGKSVVGTGQK